MVSWGGWEYSGGNGMRVGIEVHVEQDIGHGDPNCAINVEYWTENQFSYSDGQSLNLGGAIGGSIGYTNNQGGSPVKRGERNYSYEYGANEYLTNSSRTFSATVNGAFNGVTPSKSVTVNIPNRPFAAPAAPSAAAASRINDQSNRVTWKNNPDPGQPYNTIQVERYVFPPGGAGSWNVAANLGGTANTYADSAAIPNRKYQYRVRAENNVGNSGYDNTGNLWTSPGTPGSCARADSGANQLITWNNNVGYSEYSTQVWHAANGVWDSTPLATVAGGVTSYTHTAPSASVKHKYRVRAVHSSYGTALYSDYSGITSETLGTTSVPNAPTNLDPFGYVVVDQTVPIVLGWQHNPTDSSAQTAYSVRHREEGTSTWTTVPKATSDSSIHELAAGTYGTDKTVEWQVQTWGAHTDPSAWSESAFFQTQTAIPLKYPVFLDVASGRLEASSTGGEEGAVPFAHGRWTSTHTGLIASGAFTTKLGWVEQNVADPAVGITQPANGYFEIGEAGWYAIAFSVMIDSAPPQRRVARLLLNDSIELVRYEQPWFSTGLTSMAKTSLGATWIGYLAAEDLLCVQGWQSTGSNQNWSGDVAANVISISAIGTGPQGLQGPPGVGITDGNKGDITVSGTGSSWQINASAVTSAEIADGTIVDGDVATANKDGAIGTASMRTLGSGALQAAAGNHGHGLADAAITGILPVSKGGMGGAGAIVQGGVMYARLTSWVDSTGAGTAGQMLLSGGTSPPTWANVPTALPPNGTASGDLTGTYPGPTIANLAVGTGKIADDAVTNAKIGDGAVDSTQINFNAVRTAHINDTEVTWAKLNADTKNLAVGTPSLRKLGTGSTDAAAGDHTHVGLAPALDIKDESTLLTSSPTGLKFAGAGVTASGSPEVTVTVPAIPTIQVGTTSTGVFSAVNTDKTVNVTFSPAFASTPWVVGMPLAASSQNVRYTVTLISKSTTGASFSCSRATGTTAFEVEWIAVLP